MLTILTLCTSFVSLFHLQDPALGFDKSVLEKAEQQPGFKRKLSKREKKEKKKRERERGKENANGGDDSVANKLYTEAPETSFTRSISNPEAVMRRRRQQKLEKKLAQMNTTDGSSDSGEYSWQTFMLFIGTVVDVGHVYDVFFPLFLLMMCFFLTSFCCCCRCWVLHVDAFC